MGDVEVILDDTSSFVSYPSGTWVHSNVDVDGASNSVTCAESPGSVSMTYKFHSVGVWAYYWPGADVPQLTCTVDGTSVQVRDPPDTSSNPNIYWKWYVCQAQGLSSHNHTVEITVTEATQAQEFCLDTFYVAAPQAAQLLESEGSSTSSSSTSTTSPTSSPTSAVMAKAKTSVGAVVGGTLGGIALTLLICGALFFWYRRRKQHQYARMSGDDGDFDRHTLHSRRRSTVLSSFRFGPWGRRKQRKEPTWVEARHPVSIVPPLLEKSSSSRPAHVASRPDLVRARSVDFPPEDRTVTPQDLGLPDLLWSEKPDERGEHANATVPAETQLVSSPITPQSVENSDTASPGHIVSPPATLGRSTLDL